MFSTRLKELREDRGLSQEQLAKEIGYTQSNLAKWERKMHDPPTDAVIALAKFFNVTTDYLLGLEDYETAIPDYSKYKRNLPEPKFAEPSGILDKPHNYRADIRQQMEELDEQERQINQKHNQVSIVDKSGESETYELEEDDAAVVRRILESMKKSK